MLSAGVLCVRVAVAVMLAGGGAVALGAPHRAPVVVILCVVGAVSTLAAGSWQDARYTLNSRAMQANARAAARVRGARLREAASPARGASSPRR